MPVIGINLNSINAEKTKDFVQGEIKINNNTDLKKVEEQDLKGLGKKGLKVDFEFTVSYTTGNKSFGKIVMDGVVLFLDDEKESSIESWKNFGKLPDDVNVEVLNTILRRCMTKSISISEDVQLPPPLIFPYATKKQFEDAQRETDNKAIG